MWTNVRSGLMGTQVSTSLWGFLLVSDDWSARFLQAKVFSLNLLSINQPTNWLFNMTQEKRCYLRRQRNFSSDRK